MSGSREGPVSCNEAVTVSSANNKGTRSGSDCLLFGEFATGCNPSALPFAYEFAGRRPSKAAAVPAAVGQGFLRRKVKSERIGCMMRSGFIPGAGSV